MLIQILCSMLALLAITASAIRYRWDMAEFDTDTIPAFINHASYQQVRFCIPLKKKFSSWFGLRPTLYSGFELDVELMLVRPKERVIFVPFYRFPREQHINVWQHASKTNRSEISRIPYLASEDFLKCTPTHCTRRGKMSFPHIRPRAYVTDGKSQVCFEASGSIPAHLSGAGFRFAASSPHFGSAVVLSNPFVIRMEDRLIPYLHGRTLFQESLDQEGVELSVNLERPEKFVLLKTGILNRVGVELTVKMLPLDESHELEISIDSKISKSVIVLVVDAGKITGISIREPESAFGDAFQVSFSNVDYFQTSESTSGISFTMEIVIALEECPIDLDFVDVSLSVPGNEASVARNNFLVTCGKVLPHENHFELGTAPLDFRYPDGRMQLRSFEPRTTARSLLFPGQPGMLLFKTTAHVYVASFLLPLDPVRLDWIWDLSAIIPFACIPFLDGFEMHVYYAGQAKVIRKVAGPFFQRKRVYDPPSSVRALENLPLDPLNVLRVVPTNRRDTFAIDISQEVINKTPNATVSIYRLLFDGSNESHQLLSAFRTSSLSGTGEWRSIFLKVAAAKMSLGSDFKYFARVTFLGADTVVNTPYFTLVNEIAYFPRLPSCPLLQGSILPAFALTASSITRNVIPINLNAVTRVLYRFTEQQARVARTIAAYFAGKERIEASCIIIPRHVKHLDGVVEADSPNHLKLMPAGSTEMLPRLANEIKLGFRLDEPRGLLISDVTPAELAEGLKSWDVESFSFHFMCDFEYRTLWGEPTAITFQTVEFHAYNTAKER